MRQCALLICTLAMAAPAAASSDDAWKAMASDVKQKCLAATKDSITKASVAVDPFGSQRFGLAVVSGTAKGGKTPISQICVYDKVAKTAEVGSELGRDILKVDIPAAARK